MKDLPEDISLLQPDAARYLGLSQSFLAKSRCSGFGPRYCKLGRRVAYRKSDLDAWREERVYASTSQYPQRLQAATASTNQSLSQ